MKESIATNAQITAFAKFLAASIPAAAKSPNPRAWTTAVFDALVEFSNQRSWKLHPEERPYRGEYLTDFMLFEDDYGPRVACESQWWHIRSVHEDKLDWAFDKLRGVKADVKLFICEGELSAINAIAKKYLSNYALISSSEAFLTMTFNHGQPAAFSWLPKREGVHKPSEIAFEQILLG
jgi:hypothetical protein